MFDVLAFNAMLARNAKTKEDVAELLGINPVTLYRKLKGTSDFTRAEIQTLRLAFELNAAEVDQIFFAS